MSNSILPVLIFGTGGVAREIVFYIEEINSAENEIIYEISGFIGKDEKEIGKDINGVKVVTCDNALKDFIVNNGHHGLILPIGIPSAKYRISKDILKDVEDVEYPNIIHPSATIDMKRLDIGKGNIIAPGVRITTDVRIGDFNLFNYNVTVGHDVVIGDCNVINPLASISGWVELAGENLVGTGANILQNIRIGRRTTIGAGSVITKDFGEDIIVTGIPGRPIQ